MGIKIVRIRGTQQYEPRAICDLCGETIIDGSGHVRFKPNGNASEFDLVIRHIYPADGSRQPARTCEYLTDRDDKPKARGVSGLDIGIPLEKILFQLFESVRQ